MTEYVRDVMYMRARSDGKVFTVKGIEYWGHRTNPEPTLETLTSERIKELLDKMEQEQV